jgi:hypothetical protein
VKRGHAANGPCQRQEVGGVCPSDIAGGCPHTQGCSAPPDVNGLSATALAERIGHLYLCEELSTYRIAAILGISRQRIGRMLHRMGAPVKARGLGRPRQPAQSAVSTEILKSLYLQQRLTSGQVSALTGISERTVRDRLHAAGVDMRSRGGQNREDRRTVPAEAVAELYLHAGLSAAEAGNLLHVPGRVILRTAHDLGLPVRVGGPPPRRGPTEIELVDALYADPLVRRTLARYGVPRIPAGGPISQRFPVAFPIGPELAAELYVDCGLGTRHIELLSGQPAETVRTLLRRQGIQLRTPGGRSPFLRRWRSTPEPTLGLTARPVSQLGRSG